MCPMRKPGIPLIQMYKLIALRHTGLGIYTPYSKLEYVMDHNCSSDRCDFIFASDLSQSIQLNNIQRVSINLLLWQLTCLQCLMRVQ